MDRESLDNSGNYDFQTLRGFLECDLLKPVADYKNPQQIAWPDNKKFAACLTHDVDHVTCHSFSETIRRFKNLNQFDSFPDKCYLTLKYLNKLICAGLNFFPDADPFWHFEKWLEVEREVDAKSTFFFFPDSPSTYHNKDCRYKKNDRIKFLGEKLPVSEVMRLLHQEGWEIGLHGSYHSYDDSDELVIQKKQIEACIGGQILSNRMHTLHFHPELTPKALEKAGFLYDSSLGFNRIVGFRNGTSFPFVMTGNLIQIPMHVMDSALFRHDNLNLAPEEALDYCKMIIDRVKEVGGVVTFNWHHGRVNEILFPGYFEVYRESLRYLQHQDAFIGSVKEIGYCLFEKGKT